MGLPAQRLGPVELRAVNLDDYEAVSYVAGSPCLRPERMVNEQPYVVVVGGQKLVAVKHKQGSIEFYLLP